MEETRSLWTLVEDASLEVHGVASVLRMMSYINPSECPSPEELSLSLFSLARQLERIKDELLNPAIVIAMKDDRTA